MWDVRLADHTPSLDSLHGCPGRLRASYLAFLFILAHHPSHFHGVTLAFPTPDFPDLHFFVTIWWGSLPFSLFVFTPQLLDLRMRGV